MPLMNSPTHCHHIDCVQCTVSWWIHNTTNIACYTVQCVLTKHGPRDTLVPLLSFRSVKSLQLIFSSSYTDFSCLSESIDIRTTSPGSPSVPFLPGIPLIPGVPDGPLIPVFPGSPVIPGIPDFPGTPLAPGLPLGPSAPGSPSLPSLPATFTHNAQSKNIEYSQTE